MSENPQREPRTILEFMLVTRPAAQRLARILTFIRSWQEELTEDVEEIRNIKNMDRKQVQQLLKSEPEPPQKEQPKFVV